MKSKPLLNFIGILIFTITVFLFLMPLFIIKQDVKNICYKAKEMYGKECVTSLIVFAQDDFNTYEARNTAIWALGQLADKKAVKFLDYLDTTIDAQQSCDRSTQICKYEVQKSLKWCNNGNITHFMYREEVFR